MTESPPTLRTIAALSGLAVPTVSRALGDAPDISLATKARVQEIARKIGYVPNRAGVRLRTGRTNVIGMVLAPEHDVMNMTATLIAAVAEHLRLNAYHLNVTPDFADDDPLKAIRYLVETRSVDAVIFNRTKPEDVRVRYLMERRFPFVTHGRTLWSDRHAWIDFDNEAFGASAVDALFSAGRRDLLVILPPMDQTYAGHIRDGVFGRAAELGVSTRIADTITSDSPREDVAAGIRRVLAAAPGLDGLICPSPNATMAAITAFEAAGRAVGREIDVVAKETVTFLGMFRPAIMTVREDVGHAGHLLAEGALEAVRSPDAAPVQRLDSASAPT
ncbi:LacI family transcriptional regulator [Fodinicurvata sp. EGI_FJ10296]|uniref:LacI family transcriptional regulator n=1 Tax=Fodinicurvata sp. EGI_FJ10296 TaxID=3231908 RepID=UPI0034565A3A